MEVSGVKLDVGNVLGQIGQLAKDIREVFTGKAIADPQKAAELQAKAQEIELKVIQAQTDINRVEASHPSIFVSGWRPFVGWVCAFALGYHYMGIHLMAWVLILANVQGGPPKLDTEGLLTILSALLGLGTLRTWEKTKGVEGNR